MNRLSRTEQARIIRALVEGNSIRSTSRITGFAQNTIMKLLRDLGTACAEYQDRTLRNLSTVSLECDEIWSFCYAKARNVPENHAGEYGYGDVWTWTAIDQDSRLVVSWLVGTREVDDANAFAMDLRSRLANRVQITTDGHLGYLSAVEHAFGRDVDYAMLIKQYGRDGTDSREIHQARKYSPNKVTSQEVRIVMGNPDPERISTSYVERQNLNIRMGNRRFTRLTNAFSKKIENHTAAVTLQFMYHNFARVHAFLANPYPRTPAMAAGVADHVWTCEEIAGLLER
ncbi:MAG: IS1 family transposase [Chloroflexi bacterium]|nr:IS1 family transposase [Chloroflexota bacterium]